MYAAGLFCARARVCVCVCVWLFYFILLLAAWCVCFFSHESRRQMFMHFISFSCKLNLFNTFFFQESHRIYNPKTESAFCAVLMPSVVLLIIVYRDMVYGYPALELGGGGGVVVPTPASDAHGMVVSPDVACVGYYSYYTRGTNNRNLKTYHGTWFNFI